VCRRATFVPYTAEGLAVSRDQPVLDHPGRVDDAVEAAVLGVISLTAWSTASGSRKSTER